MSLGYPSTAPSLMASLLHFCRVIPFLHLRLRSTSSPGLLFLPSLNRPSSCTATEPSHSHDNATATTAASDSSASDISKPPFHHSRGDHTDYRRWKDREAEIFEDIEPIILLTKDILHSSRYMDGERLTAEDEKAVIERLLKHHPHSSDKIGCGLDSIMVDRHPQFRHSRCLFVVRTDGVWIDFSYQKCLRAYILEKYPSYAERFIRKHFKRG